MKKKRILYFDAMRLIAVICVFSCHFNRTLEYLGIGHDAKIFPDSLFSLYTGSVGVTLFFIISGAALMYVYEEKLDLKKYYLKRFLGIYPMFWIAYICFFFAKYFINKGFDKSIPLHNFIYTILGCDGVAEFYTRTFIILGEWFLIVIVMLYVVFPLLRLLLLKAGPITSLTLVTAVTLLIALNYHMVMPMDVFFINRIPEFLFGMIFIKYIKKVRWFAALPAAVCLAIMTFIPFPNMNLMIRIWLVGIPLFLVLVFLFSHLERFSFVRFISGFISKYSYPIFLVHHAFMMLFLARFTGSYCSKLDLLILYFMTLSLTLVLSFLLDKLTSAVLSVFKKQA